MSRFCECASCAPTACRPGIAASAHQAVRVEPMSDKHLEQVLAIENISHQTPWTRGNFADSIASGHAAYCLLRADTLLGYLVAMPCLDEAHLLNITVAPPYQRQGLAAVLLCVLDTWAIQRQLKSIWLEVRQSNQRAQEIYRAHGYSQAGSRRDYYRCANGTREDALLMSLEVHKARPVATTLAASLSDRAQPDASEGASA